MRDSSEPRAKRRSLPTEVGAFWRLPFVVVLLNAGSIGLAQDQDGLDPETPRAAKRRAASNQSVSIDTPLSDPATGAVGAGPASGVQADATSQPINERPVVAAPTPPRTIRRRSAGPSEETLLGGRSTPWYRTGLGALTVVLALVGLVFFLARRYVPSIRAADGGVLRVVTRTSLTSKQTLALIQLGRRFVMVAVSPSRVDVLSEVSDPKEVAELTAQAGASWPRGGEKFDQLLSREADDFSRTSSEAFDIPNRTEPSTARKSSGPVADLLTRLRALQRSH